MNFIYQSKLFKQLITIIGLLIDEALYLAKSKWKNRVEVMVDNLF